MEDFVIKYRKELLENVIPFWEKYSIDKEYGGYLTCLDRDGSVFDTDKFMWLQGRQIWTMSMLYDKVEAKETLERDSRTWTPCLILQHGRD
ncbi:AGE family epimerase/isomerase [Sphingobacterium sp. T2]|uniref:AGE family epimerase/isomerase n=1 Tax=Sphingobacterium sp. T2 TaxID=1590596 RepID=UPI00057B9BBB|nr:AGE family epimerase/isomerase [Sphingobacterium sp. T2]